MSKHKINKWIVDYTCPYCGEHHKSPAEECSFCHHKIKDINTVGTKVKCKTYLSKFNNFVHIEKIKDRWVAYSPIPKEFLSNKDRLVKEDEPFNLFEEFFDDRYYINCGEYVDKNYYNIIKKEFIGYIIDEKLITVNSIIGIDCDTKYDGSEYEYVYKQPIKQILCYKVSYAIGKTRWVPVIDVEII